MTGLGLAPREVILDGGFMPGPTDEALAELAPEYVFISGRQQEGSRRTRRPNRTTAPARRVGLPPL